MLFTAEGSAGRATGKRPSAAMGGAPERSSKPLHNFSLPLLKWGGQRQMRCVKIDSPNALRFLSPGRSPPPDERRRELGFGGEIDCDREIRLAREKFLDDLRTEMDRMKGSLFPPEAADADKDDDSASRPWNLRTRRAACKAPADGPDGGKPQPVASPSPPRSDGKNVKAGLRSGAEKKKEERVKFSPFLARKEVEEDFLLMTGHRPSRKPKKRPRIVQKQIDMLLPGLWLTEVTVDTYKVVEIPDNVKVNSISGSGVIQDDYLLVTTPKI